MFVPVLSRSRSEVLSCSLDILSPASLKKLGSSQLMLSDEDLDMEQFHQTIRRSSNSSVSSLSEKSDRSSGKRRTMKDVKHEAHKNRASRSNGSGESSRGHSKESSRSKRSSRESPGDKRSSRERSRDGGSSRDRRSSRENLCDGKRSRSKRNSGECERKGRRSSRSHFKESNKSSSLRESFKDSEDGIYVEEEDEITLKASKSTPNLLMLDRNNRSDESLDSPDKNTGTVATAYAEKLQIVTKIY